MDAILRKKKVDVLVKFSGIAAEIVCCTKRIQHSVVMVYHQRYLALLSYDRALAQIHSNHHGALDDYPLFRKLEGASFLKRLYVCNFLY